jgi:hypothetical protein
MKKQKFSFKSLLFKSATEFKSWYNYIIRKFTDIKIVSVRSFGKLIVYKIKYSIS